MAGEANLVLGRVMHAGQRTLGTGEVYAAREMAVKVRGLGELPLGGGQREWGKGPSTLEATSQERRTTSEAYRVAT